MLYKFQFLFESISKFLDKEKTTFVHEDIYNSLNYYIQYILTRNKNYLYETKINLPTEYELDLIKKILYLDNKNFDLFIEIIDRFILIHNKNIDKDELIKIRKKIIKRILRFIHYVEIGLFEKLKKELINVSL